MTFLLDSFYIGCLHQSETFYFILFYITYQVILTKKQKMS